HCIVDRVVGVVAHHPTPGQDLGELHSPQPSGPVCPPERLAALAPPSARCARAPPGSLRSRPLPALGRTPPLHCRSMGEKSGGSYSDQFPNRRLGKVPPPMPEVEPRISPPRSGGRHGRPCRRWSQGLVPHEVGEGTAAEGGGRGVTSADALPRRPGSPWTPRRSGSRPSRPSGSTPGRRRRLEPPR